MRFYGDSKSFMLLSVVPFDEVGRSLKMDKPKKMSQNIFQYATSELSQDAFISLIIAWFPDFVTF